MESSIGRGINVPSTLVELGSIWFSHRKYQIAIRKLGVFYREKKISGLIRVLNPVRDGTGRIWITRKHSWMYKLLHTSDNKLLMPPILKFIFATNIFCVVILWMFFALLVLCCLHAFFLYLTGCISVFLYICAVHG